MIESINRPHGSSIQYERNIDDFIDVLDVVEHRLEQGPSPMGESSLMHGDPEGFTQTSSLEEAYEFALNGWEEGAERILDVAQDVDHRAVIAREALTSVRSHGVAGTRPDIPKVIAARDPYNMHKRSWEHTYADRRVEFIVNTSFAGSVETDQIINRGVAIAVAMQSLRASNHEVALSMLTRIAPDPMSGDNLLQYRTPILKFGANFNLDALAFTMHPSFLRRIMFAVMEAEPASIRRSHHLTPSGKYGWPAHIKSNNLERNAEIKKYGAHHPDRFPAPYEHPTPAVLIDNTEGMHLDSITEIQNYSQLIVRRSERRMSAEDA